MRSFFDVIRGWQGSVKRIFYYGKKKQKNRKNQLTLVSGCSIIIMELGDTNLLDKLFYSCETKPYLISAYIGNNPVRFPCRVYIGRTVSRN